MVRDLGLMAWRAEIERRLLRALRASGYSVTDGKLRSAVASWERQEGPKDEIEAFVHRWLDESHRGKVTPVAGPPCGPFGDPLPDLQQI